MMNVLITRSFAEHTGLEWPKDVAYVRNGRRVTWAEVLAQRRARQQQRLARIRQPDPHRLRPAHLWTFFNDGWIYHGWFCYVKPRGEESFSNGYKGRVEGESDWAQHLMRQVPLVPPAPENWDAWKEALADHHPKPPSKDMRRAGLLAGWTDGHNWWRNKPATPAPQLP